MEGVCRMNAAPTCYRFLAATTFAILGIQSPAGIPTRQTQRPAESPLRQPARANLNRDYGKLPLAFEPNTGQTDARVRFLARGGGMTTFFTDAETVMVLSRSRQVKKPEGPGRPEALAGEVEQAVVRMKLAGAGQPRRATGLEKLSGISNYFIGNDPAKWRTDVPHFARIQYEGVYPGIDLVWYGNQQRLEYDFVVAPGADPRQIQVAYEGVESLRLDAGGNLVLRTALGEMRQQKPRVYQEVGGKQVEVEARYTIVARDRVTFALARYDRKRELRIDPVVLVYSTYLGGSGGDWGYGIAVDAAGSAYVTGQTTSTNFPTQSAYQTTYQDIDDVFVTKLTPAGNALVYSTYLGGDAGGGGSAITVDGAGSAYVTGSTYSTNFPTQSAYQAMLQGNRNAFVTKLTPAGNALVYSTYLGGSFWDYGYGIAVDAAGSAYVTGLTASPNFPTQSPYQTFGGVFVTKLTPAGSALVYSTRLGGSGVESGNGIAVDGAGSAYVTGDTSSPNFPTKSAYRAILGGAQNAFVTKLTPAGNGLVYSTYLGGSDYDRGNGIAVDGVGSAYVTGDTSSTNFPTQSAYQAALRGNRNAFVTKLTPAGNALVYSTYLGGSFLEIGYGIAVDGAGSTYVMGETSSTNFPTQSPYQTFGGTFVTKFTPAGNGLVYSTYLGGSSYAGPGIAVDGAGSAYVTGAASADFPTQSAYQATFQGGAADAFVTKLAGPYTSLSLSMTHAANFTQGQNGATYTVAVKNTNSTDTSGTVTVTETLPSGLILVSMAGMNWACLTNTCTRSDPLSPGASYPPITVTVNVALNAPSSVTNTVTVSGGGFQVGLRADDVTTINPLPKFPVWIITKTHTGNFTQGQTGATYTITANNIGYAPSSGAVTVTDTLPAGLSATGIFSVDYSWNCTLATLSCTRSDALSVGASYPPITVRVNVASNASSPQVNVARVSGGGSATAQTTDSTTIIISPFLSIAKGHTGNFTQGQAGATYTVTVSNGAAAGPTSGTVTVTETVPSGMTLVSMAGAGWTCPSGGTTCTTSSVLNGGASYPPITVTVNVASNAGTPLSNSVSVSGGGSANNSYSDSTIIGIRPPQPVIALVANAAGEGSAIAPNTWVEVKGQSLAPAGDSRIWQGSDFVNSQLPKQLDGVSVTVNGNAAYVYFISPGQVNILTPPDAMSGAVQVQVTNNGTASAVFTAQAQALSPSLFVFNGVPYVAATHSNGSLIGPTALYPGSTTPAQPGEAVVLYANGFGPTSVTVVSGSMVQGGSLSPSPAIKIGGVTAEVQFAGLVGPGEYQFNVVVPSTLADGDQPVTATYNGLSTQTGTLITIQH